MKKIAFLILFMIPIFCMAQTNGTQLAKNEEFCAVTIMTAGNKFEIYVGDSTKKKDKQMVISDSKGKAIKFNTFVSALNCLEQKGWTLLTSTSSIANGFPNESSATFIYKRNIDSKN